MTDKSAKVLAVTEGLLLRSRLERLQAGEELPTLTFYRFETENKRWLHVTVTITERP